MSITLKKIIFFFFLTIAIFTVAHFALAADLDVGLNEAAETGLGAEDPRVMAANIIRIVLGFLGIIAVGLIMYAGWLWMTAEGNEEKLEKAKKILTGAIIGLIIILSAFAIASFILSKLLEATGGDTGGGGGGTTIPGGGGGGGGGGLPGVGEACLTDLLDTTCAAGECDSGLECGTGCVCEETTEPGEGESCDGDTATDGCQEADCSGNLLCSPDDSCTCQKAPLISWVSPLDASSTPNGAAGNFITIGGQYFGTSTGEIIFMGDIATETDDKTASFPNSVNANCTSYWQDDQIIVIVPDGAIDGPLKVAATSGKEDTTDNNRGPLINNFDVNDQVRPGLCLADPDNGYFEDAFNLQGNAFDGADQKVLFGNETSSTTAGNIANWTNTSVDASVPNVTSGRNAVFTSVGGVSSNSLRFTVHDDSERNPYIDYIDPAQGPTGQYITIYGGNFKTYESGKSAVQFYLEADSTNLINADIDFPEACADKWWHDTYITVKAPSADAGDYKVIVTNKESRTSEAEDFSVTSGSPGPGLCALDPHNGPVGQAISAYGENFGSTQGMGKAAFYNSIESSISEWADEEVDTSVPSGAETGPFEITDNNGDTSNSLPFTVGSCSSSDECELGEECCASGTYWSEICRTEGDCDEGAPTTCTYSWTFSTSGEVEVLTCGGYTTAEACLAADMCPNSPGQCQSKSDLEVGGGCGDDYCNDTYSSCAGQCVYLESVGDEKINKCSLAGASCDQTKTWDNYTAECQEVDGEGVWQVDSDGASCPTGSFLDTNDWCTLGSLSAPETCNLCSSGFSCESGKCVIGSSVCPSGSECSDEKCLKTSGICECCCRVGYDNEDCCAGLTCEAGGCGSDEENYGLCTGCKVLIDGVADQEASNNTCNCHGGSTRYCDLSDSTNYPNGVCRDLGGEGDPCDSNISNSTCEADSDLCLDGYYCDSTNCTCKKGADEGESCDSDTSTSACDADSSICGTNLSCDSETCTCQITESFLGLSCEADDTSTSTLTCDPDKCDFWCATEEGKTVTATSTTSSEGGCGTCCCDPDKTSDDKTSDKYDKCNTLSDSVNLTCEADRGPCSGDNRGLCCGCSQDSHCAGGTSLGCSFDACCRARPSVENTEPDANATSICRNAQINATFNQLMDTASFSENVLVFGDYDSSECPSDTEYLTLNGKNEKTFLRKMADGFIRFLAKLPFVNDLFFSGRAYALTDTFCSIKGTVSGYNTADEKTVLTFSPSKLLDGGRKYYVVIKGDGNTSDATQSGVLSYYNIGMETEDEESFNNVTYKGKIWSFTTLGEQAENNGVCAIDRVEVEPDSYLFSTTANDSSENDSDPTNSAFDTAEDSDKVFAAKAISEDGQTLSSITGYSWKWGWSSSKTSVANAVDLSESVLASDKKLIRAKEGVTDDQTTLTATANAVDGWSGSVSGAAEAYVFVCANPWPPVGNDGTWEPWQDDTSNCLSNSGNCYSTNYELYYCRDSGEAGTADDLPAILSDGTIVRGSSTSQNIFKEFYFLHEETPPLTSIEKAEDQKTGGKVYVKWSAVSGAAGYKLYYGTASGSYDNNVETTATEHTLTGLTNNKTYYLAVTAYYSSGAESTYSKEATVTPTDQTAPSASASLTATAGDAQVALSWSAVEGASKYKIYYGTTSGTYGASIEAGNVTSYAVSSLSNGQTYYFAITSIDSANNESSKSSEKSATPTK